ncbi:MAG: cation:proton antiporter [Moraxellaceae bacterium]|nr:cation:proton antiporter [Moraxellaceae bacterium]MDZ4296946.1 cation:proton antiporter [Moraxellaceae bacterium]MDZ4386655.1 cation:proton antiporter [Moraxellaceae bacterium]
MISSAVSISYFLISLALLIIFIRLVLGPTLPDRVVALELMATLTLAFIGIYSIDSGKDHFLDVGLVIALTSFLAAIGFARYLEKRGSSDVD